MTKIKRPFKWPSQVSAGVWMALAALCQTGARAADIPASTDAGRIEREHDPVPQVRSTPSGALVEVPTSEMTRGADIALTLRSVKLEGAYAIPQKELSKLYHPLLGTRTSVARLNEVVNEITNLYRNAGFILAQASLRGAQELDPDAADVVIQVVEGYIDQIKYADPDYATGSKGRHIRAYLSKIPQSCHGSKTRPAGLPCPLHQDTLERYLLLARDLGGVDIQTVLVPGDKPGSASLYVTVKEKHVDAFANGNNRGTRYLGPWALLGGLQSHNLSGLYENLGLQYETSTHTRELQYIQASSTVPLGSEGLSVSLAGNYARARPGWTLAPLEIDSRVRSVSLTALYPLFRTRAINWTLKGSFLGRDYDLYSVGTRLNEDRIRELTLGVTFDFADPLLGGAVTLADLSVAKGISGLGSSAAASPLLSRSGAALDFTKAILTLSRLQQLASKWSWLFEATGQYSANRLVTSEQFGYGGERFGRAYDSSELLGDSGAAFRTELQATPVMSATSLTGLQAYGFYDIGKTWNRHECGCGTPQPRAASGSSAGLGLRGNLGSATSAYVEVAKPLTRDVQTEGDRHARVFVSLSYRY